MVPFCSVTRQEKELKTLRQTRRAGRVSVEILENYEWGKQKRHRRGKSKARLGSWGKSRSLQEWPKTFHAICATRSVSSGYSAQRYDYLTTFAMVLDWQRSPKDLSRLAEASDSTL